MKRSKGFTLIELLAVIVILAIIALIAIPQVLKILNKARISAAEDTTYGIVKSAENYVTEFMLQNNGNFASNALEFKCENKKCELQNIPSEYNTENLTVLNFNGTKPTSGVVTISDNGKNIVVTELIVNGFTCNYVNEVATCGSNENNNQTTTTTVACTNKDDNGFCITTTTYETGDAITLAGYNWHVISDDGVNLTLLMDAGQINNMAHCTNDTNAASDCGVDSTGTYYVYSWEDSLIRTYLNGEFLNNFALKDKLLSSEICADASHYGDETTYGGYLKSEIESFGVNCSGNYVTDYVRLMSKSEYLLKSKLNDRSWFDSANIGNWWTMGASNSPNLVDQSLRPVAVTINNYMAGYDGSNVLGVRPVITIQK